MRLLFCRCMVICLFVVVAPVRGVCAWLALAPLATDADTTERAMPKDSTAQTSNEQPSNNEQPFDPLKFGIITGVSAGAVVSSTVFFSNVWWNPRPFHINSDDDYRYALNADKLGHFYTPYLLTNLYSQAFRWAGMRHNESLYWSAGLAMTFMTYMEIRDGFSKYGFSWGDMAANLVGAAYPVLQDRVSVLRNFTVKISFYPSEKFRAGGFGVIIDDYESTFHWLSVNVRGLLPPEAQAWYPAWLNLAIGHGVRNVDGLGGGEHELYLALDWNLEGLPECGWFCDLLKRNLNFYRLPAPAVRILPNVVWFGLKF